MKLVFASSSPYKRSLLHWLRLEFEIYAQNIDETPSVGELAPMLGLRLATSKAHAAAAKFANAVIISCGQTASLSNQLIGKSGSYEAAVEQLRFMSGNSVTCYCVICVLHSRNREAKTSIVENLITFSHLSDNEIEEYLVIEQPYDCTGSAKIDGLGIALVKSVQGPDPTSIIALLMITLIKILRDFIINLSK